ncbi:protein ITPRID2 [Engraulis encrasicolus]|uniref:protein ITPRID2 n=1 Tax=Engraulis encrasicolus TaxID=184585 RepID=UPI002FD11A22
METPSPTVRRHAWVHSSWLTLEETEHLAPYPAATDLAPHLSPQEDEVFLGGGCATGKIETWLQGCGLDTAGQDDTKADHGQLTLESLLKTYSSFEDDLSLGAEATALHHVARLSVGCSPVLLPPPKSRQKPLTTRTPQQRLALPLYNMGHSMASSCLSSTTNKTASSISEVLQMCTEDAEETLYQLGFGCDEPQVTARIPSRFFNFPSRLRGINFRLFLESQLRRVSQEDPNLSLASRFRQVEVLTMMANAFYSLYSHVSKTPVQKLAPPEFSFSPAAEKRIGVRFFGGVRSEPRSPVERLKDTVSKMCLYASARTSDSTSSPHTSSPRKRWSFPEITTAQQLQQPPQEQHLDPKEDRGDPGLQDDNNRGRLVDDNMRCGTNVPVDAQTEIVTEEKAEGPSHTALCSHLDSTEHSRTRSSDPKEAFHQRSAVRDCRTRLKFSDPCPPKSATDDRDIREKCKKSVAFRLQSQATQAPVARVPKVTHDVICPPVVEQVHQAPYVSLQDFRTSSGPCCVVDIPTSPTTLELKDQPNVDPYSRLGHAVNVPEICTEHNSGKTELPSLSSSSSSSLDANRFVPPCRILVTGWDDEASPGDAAAASASASAPGTKEDGATPTPPSRPQRLLAGILRKRRYLCPSKDSAAAADQPRLSHNLMQANSFELEEVHSAGEDDGGQAELRAHHTTARLSAVGQNKSLPPRGDSFQSDSSGYAEEELM